MINYNQGKGSGFKALPEGHYEIRIDDVQQGASSKGNPQLEFSMTIVDGEYTDRHPKMWKSLMPNAVWSLEALAEVCGITPQETGEHDDEGNPEMALDEQEFIGRVVTFKVTQREYQGRTNNDFEPVELSEFDPGAGVAGDDEEEEDDTEDEQPEEKQQASSKKGSKKKGSAAEPGTRRRRRPPN